MTEALDKTPAVPRPFNEGDQVYVRRGFLGSDIHRAVVTRVTKTQATVGSIRYNRQTGRLIGGSAHSSSWIEHPTPILDVQYRQMSDALDKARATRARIDDRLAVARMGRSLTREMDQDMLALNEARASLAALIAEHERLTSLYPFFEKRPKTDNAPPADDERIVIHANSNVTRGKFAAAAVHAALTAAGVHPGCPVIVLGAKPRDIENLTTVIRDAGLTEVKPGTITAGTDWSPSPPADDERTWVVGFLLGAGVREDRAEEYAGKFLAGFRRRDRGPVTDAMVEAALGSWFGLVASWNGKTRARMRAALEAAEEAR